MKARNLLWTSIVNIFLVLLVSVIMEYSSLNSRFKQLENIISTATDTAVRVSTGSEEMFSEKRKLDSTGSYATTASKEVIESNLKVLARDSNEWVDANTYVMSKFYEEHNRFPRSQNEIDTFSNTWGTDEDIYEWLFGKVGSIYNKYPWANDKTRLWHSSLWDGYTVGEKAKRKPSENFGKFYDNIGKMMKSKTYVKVRNGSTFNVELKEIPTLAQMGLHLDDLYNGSGEGGDYTNDFLSSVVHFGKKGNSVSHISYYLTPYSLGVTYVPIEVLKPVILAHTEQLIRFNKVKHTVTSSDNLSDFRAADGCLTTDVFTGFGNEEHKNSDASSRILNDGEIEYDLGTLKVKVDYFLVDFYNKDNYKIVNKIEGAVPGGTLNDLPDKLKSLDTSYGDKDGNRIVAKVSVKLKVHIPYKSTILQWFRQLNDNDGNNHYDVRLWDETNNQVEFNSDGVWFYYTTYTAISR